MRWLGDRRGGVAIMAALFGGLLCGLAALAVDVGSVALEARKLQGATDLAALSAASDLAHAQAAARATATDNMGAGVVAVVTTGSYLGDRSLAPSKRFSAGPTKPNAVRVQLSRPARLYFGRWILGRDTVDLSRTATAAATQDPPRAVFSIGSRLAALDGGLANQLLSGLTGSTVSLSLMDYRALADADVNLLSFSDALAVKLGVTAGDYAGLLDRKISVGQALGVLEQLAGDHADSALSKLTGPAAGLQIRLGDLIGAQADAASGLAGPLNVNVSAMDLVMAMLEIGGGDRQVALNLATPPGLAEVRLSVAIGERPNHSPWITVTDKATPVIRTAQARLYLRARTAQALSGLAQVNLPVLIELASSEARLDKIECEPARSVTLGVRPGLARASIGAIDESRLHDFTRPLTPAPATLLSVLGLVTLTAKADIEAADTGFTAVRFTDAQITNQTTKTVTSRSLAQGIIVSLLQRMDVDVHIIGLGLGLGGIVQALGALLTPLGPLLDGVINPVLDLLGLKFGQADVTVLGATCPDHTARAVLVG